MRRRVSVGRAGPVGRAGLEARLLRLYPRVWRERYGDEVLALIEQSGGGWRCAMSLVRGAAREWLRAGFTASNARWVGGLVVDGVRELLLATTVAPIAAVATSGFPGWSLDRLPLWIEFTRPDAIRGLSQGFLMAAVVIAYSAVCSLPIAVMARSYRGWARGAMFVLSIVVMLVVGRSITPWIPPLLGAALLLWRVTYRAKIGGPAKVGMVAA